MRIREVQQVVDAWVRENGGYWPPLAQMARLTEETGELAREYNHRHGPKKKKASEGDKDLALEMADVLFILVCMANDEGVDLEDAFARTMEKYRIRDAGRFK
ncbi:MAG: nucleotide pyrophosphohydrolase [Myxococcota bacterium]